MERKVRKEPIYQQLELPDSDGESIDYKQDIEFVDNKETRVKDLDNVNADLINANEFDLNMEEPDSLESIVDNPA